MRVLVLVCIFVRECIKQKKENIYIYICDSVHAMITKAFTRAPRPLFQRPPKKFLNPYELYRRQYELGKGPPGGIVKGPQESL